MNAWRAPLVCAGLALAMSGATLIPILEGARWQTSVLVHMTVGDLLAVPARRADPSFVFVSPAAQYDGVYSYAIARDPLALGNSHRLIDDGALRYASPAYGWLAGLVSLGWAPALPFVMLGLNVLLLALAASLVSLLAVELGGSPWWGLIVALNPGFIFGVTADTPEPALIAAAALGVLLWLRRNRLAAIPLAACCFVSELGLLVPAGLALYEVVQIARDRATADASKRRIASLAVGPLLYALWWLYLQLRFGSWPAGHQSALVVPLWGLAAALGKFASLSFGTIYETISGGEMVPILVVVSGALVLGIVRTLRLRTPLQAIVLPMAVATLSLSGPVLISPTELLHSVATPLTFLALALIEREPGDMRERR